MSRKRESDETFDSERKIAGLRAQNDDLLTALKAAMLAFHCPALDDKQECFCNTCARARTAIKQAEETS